MHTGVKVIHVSERDTQVTNRPKEVDEFVNTWSIEGFFEEGIAPSELGWGTHERRLPGVAHTYDYGPCSQICLSQMGMDTFVYSWVPLGGQIIGMVIRHGEALSITEHLTVSDNDRPIYRPTVHYADPTHRRGDGFAQRVAHAWSATAATVAHHARRDRPWS